MSNAVIDTEVVTDTACSVDTDDNSTLKSTSIMCTESSSTPTATEALRRAALRTKVSRATLRIFMDELRPLHPELSLDPRTLMQTLRHCEHVKVDGAEERKANELPVARDVDDAYCVTIRPLSSKYNFIKLRGIVYSDVPPDNAVVIKGQPGLITLINGDSVLVHLYGGMENWFDKCIPSTDISIFKCAGLSSHTKWFKNADIDCKCIVMDCDGYIIVYPFYILLY
ncbi:hypothetical protein AHF37_09658 [Paragonimus kellicotti]|nr:hypothetical protein AHF37_09658 [Paragonimus kellicotti]